MSETLRFKVGDRVNVKGTRNDRLDEHLGWDSNWDDEYEIIGIIDNDHYHGRRKTDGETWYFYDRWCTPVHREPLVAVGDPVKIKPGVQAGIDEDAPTLSAWTPIEYRYEQIEDVYVIWDDIRGWWELRDNDVTLGTFDTPDAAFIFVDKLPRVWEGEDRQIYLTKPSGDVKTRELLARA